MASKISILDKAIDCLTVSLALKTHGEFKITGVYSQYNKAISQFESCPPNCLIIDPQYLSEDEAQHIQQKSKEYQTNILVFSPDPYLSLSTAIYVKKPKKLTKDSDALKQLIQSLKQLQPKPSSKLTLKQEKRILLVDDSALMKMLIQNEVLKQDPNLKMVGNAQNGLEALQKLDETRPDIILLDLEMPVMDGFEFLKKARHLTQAKIIVISSIAETSHPKLKQLGADAIVEKPQGSVSLNFSNEKGSELLKTIHALSS